MKVRFLLLIFVTSIFSGCFTLGVNKGYCDGKCNYKEAGVCRGVIDIYKNRHSLKNTSTDGYTTWWDN